MMETGAKAIKMGMESTITIMALCMRAIMLMVRKMDSAALFFKIQPDLKVHGSNPALKVLGKFCMKMAMYLKESSNNQLSTGMDAISGRISLCIKEILNKILYQVDAE